MAACRVSFHYQRGRGGIYTKMKMSSRNPTLKRLLQMSMLSTAVPLSVSTSDILGFTPSFTRRIHTGNNMHNFEPVVSPSSLVSHQMQVTKYTRETNYHLPKAIFGRRHYSKSVTILNAVQGDKADDFSTSTRTDFSTRYISFISDIEGDAGYFDRFVETSHILDFENIEPQLNKSDNDADFFPYNKQVIFCDDDDDNTTASSKCQSILVCGGDMWDKGGNDLYVTRQLLSLHRRYGDERVHFIMGNRDINKIRILQELGLGDDEEDLPWHGGVFWFKGTGLQGDPDLIERYRRKEQERSGTNNSNPNKDENEDDADLKAALIPDTAPERLKWLLRRTMGSPDAFEFRRGELEQEKRMTILPSSLESEPNDTRSIVTDEEVVQSYRKSCHPNGAMGEYLSKGKLCLKLGGAMFMHGSLPITPNLLAKFQNEEEKHGNNDKGTNKDSFWLDFYQYAMPFAGKDRSGIDMPIVNSTREWIDALNDFASRQYNVWKLNVTEVEERNSEKDDQLGMWSTVGQYQNTSDGAREIGSLCQYGMGWLPGRKQNPTVVYQSWLQDGYPKFHHEDSDTYRELVKDFFNTTELDVIVTGHQPVGDLPFPIQVSDANDNKKQFVVVSDTSYSGDTKWMNGDGRKNCGRGKALSGRGEVAVSELVLQQCIESGKISSISSHGFLSDGSHYESENYLGTDEDSLLIGNLVDRKKLVFEGSIQDDSNDEVDWFVRSKLKDGTFLVSTGKGYEVFNSIAKKR